MIKSLNAFEVVIMKFFIGVSVALLCVGLMNGACSRVNKVLHLKDDNLIEEFAERTLFNETGIDLDFTPGSDEKPIPKAE